MRSSSASDDVASQTPHFRALRVEPYDPQPFLPGLKDEDEVVDVSRFSSYRYVVTFEVRSGNEWRKVRGYA